jgi:outer membrane protein TolC
MDSADLASAFVSARAGQTQLAVAAKMLRMNAESAQAVVQLLEAGQANIDKLANVAAGIGGNLDVSV